MATKENKYGIDRWTSNGHGIVMGPSTPAQKEAIKKINAELASSSPRKPVKKSVKKK